MLPKLDYWAAADSGIDATLSFDKMPSLANSGLNDDGFSFIRGSASRFRAKRLGLPVSEVHEQLP
jgi:hypothetical protein